MHSCLVKGNLEQSGAHDCVWVKHTINLLYLLLLNPLMESWITARWADNQKFFIGMYHLSDWRLVKDSFSNVLTMTLEMDNLNTHFDSSFCRSFAPVNATRLQGKADFVFTPDRDWTLRNARNRYANQVIPYFDSKVRHAPIRPQAK